MAANSHKQNGNGIVTESKVPKHDNAVGETDDCERIRKRSSRFSGRVWSMYGEYETQLPAVYVEQFRILLYSEGARARESL